MLRRFCRCAVDMRQVYQCQKPFSTSSAFYSKITQYGPTDPPKQLTFKDAEQRVLTAVKNWDRFPQDRADKLALDARFIEDLGLDSLDHVEVVMSLEDEFKMEVPDTVAEKFKTPRDMLKYVCEEQDVYE